MWIVFLWLAGPSILLWTRIKIKSKYVMNNSNQYPGAWNWHSEAANSMFRIQFEVSLSYFQKWILFLREYEHQHVRNHLRSSWCLAVVDLGETSGTNAPLLFCRVLFPATRLIRCFREVLSSEILRQEH